MAVSCTAQGILHAKETFTCMQTCSSSAAGSKLDEVITDDRPQPQPNFSWSPSLVRSLPSFVMGTVSIERLRDRQSGTQQARSRRFCKCDEGRLVVHVPPTPAHSGLYGFSLAVPHGDLAISGRRRSTKCQSRRAVTETNIEGEQAWATTDANI